MAERLGLGIIPGAGWRAPEIKAVGIPIFIGDDIAALHDLARANLAIFTFFPFYQRMFRASGFAEEAAQAEQGAGALR